MRMFMAALTLADISLLLLTVRSGSIPKESSRIRKSSHISSSSQQYLTNVLDSGLPGVEPKVAALRSLYEGKKIIVGRDKLDVVKGVLQKVDARCLDLGK